MLGGSILAYLLWFHLLKVCGATAASAYHFLMPPLGMLFAFLVLGEHVELRDLLGIVPVALGIYLVTRPATVRRLIEECDMSISCVTITLIGGPTALIEIDGFRLLTDPTFDEPGAYQLPHVKLEKLVGPALSADAIGEVDAVLLSHDQHSDNLDNSGRDFLKSAKRVLTTEAGAKRLGGHAEGFAPWQVTELTGNERALAHGHRDARASRPGRHRTAVGRRHRLRRRVEQAGQPSDLYQRRHRLVRRRRRGREALQGGRGAAVCGRGANPRPVPSHHGHQRHHRDRARVSRMR